MSTKDRKLTPQEEAKVSAALREHLENGNYAVRKLPWGAWTDDARAKKQD